MIGRLEELKQLEKFYNSSKFEFLTLCFSVSQDLQNRKRTGGKRKCGSVDSGRFVFVIGS